MLEEKFEKPKRRYSCWPNYIVEFITENIEDIDLSRGARNMNYIRVFEECRSRFGVDMDGRTSNDLRNFVYNRFVRGKNPNGDEFRDSKTKYKKMGKRGGPRSQELKRGIYGLNDNQKRKNSRKGVEARGKEVCPEWVKEAILYMEQDPFYHINNEKCNNELMAKDINDFLFGGEEAITGKHIKILRYNWKKQRLKEIEGSKK